MSEPMRFSLKHHGQLSCVEHCPEGEYVLHSDYARLKAEVERLTAFTTRTIIPNEELQAQVERLTKAGDAMAVRLAGCYRSEGYDPKECRAIDIWDAAKEGKHP